MVEKKPNKYKFSDIFIERPGGSLEPKRIVRINGVTIGPGVLFGPGTSFSGVDVFNFKGLDVAAIKDPDGAFHIKGFYAQR